MLDRERFKVSATMKNGKPVRLHCQCPMAKLGRGCKHAAALLYAIEEENQTMSDPIRPKTADATKESPINSSEQSSVKEKSTPKKEAIDAAALMESWLKEDQNLKQKEEARRIADQKQLPEINASDYTLLGD